MANADAMAAAYLAAGFRKIHLDASMGCAGEPAAVGDALAATRAARLAAAECAIATDGDEAPVYVIGTEVPVPGGSLEALDHATPTSPQAAAETYRVHEEAFRAAGLEAAFARVVGMVVQPGVEFGDAEIQHFKARARRQPQRRASYPAGRYFRGAFDGLPDASRASRPCRFRFPHPQGWPMADIRDA